MTKKLLLVEVPDDAIPTDIGCYGFGHFTPTEVILPTDEDICIYREFNVPIEHENGFFEGAKWLLTKILNQ